MESHKIVESIQTFPGMPGTAVKLLGLIDDPAMRVYQVEEIFTAALLHDVGKLVLGTYVKDDFSKIQDAVSMGVSFEKAETLALGTNHAEVGARILTRWSLPEDIVIAVQWHHEPDASNEVSTMLDIVHVANFLSIMIGIGIGSDGLQHQPSVEVSERLGLKPAHLEKVANQTMQWVPELSEILSQA